MATIEVLLRYFTDHKGLVLPLGGTARGGGIRSLGLASQKTGGKHLVRRAFGRAVADASDAWWRIRTKRAPRVLIYSDSRGLNLAASGKTRAGTYAALLARRYHVTAVLCPFSHTTLLDFLEYMETVPADRFDAVVLHCGIVDFSPRPLSNIEKVRRGKTGNPTFDRFFAAHEAYYSAPDDVLYEGEPTINLCSPDYVQSEILPRLSKIDRLVWVSSGPFAPGWEGNYDRGRPANIEAYVQRFDAILADGLQHVVDLRGWSADEVRQRTIDNIHFSAAGFRTMYELIAEAIDQVPLGRSMCSGEASGAQ